MGDGAREFADLANVREVDVGVQRTTDGEAANRESAMTLIDVLDLLGKNALHQAR